MDSGPPTLSVAQYKAGKGVPRDIDITDHLHLRYDQTIQSRTRHRVLLSGGSNQYKIALYLISRHDFRVLR
jgi:hypothetical protein